MNQNAGVFYHSIENVYYALAGLTDTNLNPSNITPRISALAHLIECIILSDRVVFESEQSLIFNETFHLINKYDLTGILVCQPLQALPLHTVAPRLLPSGYIPYEDWHRGLLTTKEIKAFENLKQNPQYESLSNPFAALMHELIDSHELDEILHSYFIVRHAAENVNTDTLLPSKREILDFCKLTIPVYASEDDSNFGQLLIEAVEHAILTGKGDKEAERTVCLLFQGFVETALATSIVNELAFYPDSLQSKLILSKPVFGPSSKVFIDKLREKKYQALSHFNDFLYNRHTKFISLPILFNYVLSKATSIEEVFSIAIDTRYKKEAQRYRSWCADLDEALENGHQEEAIAMIESASSFINDLAKKTESQLKMQVQISFPPAIIFDIPPLALTRKNHLLFLSQVYYGAHSPVTLRDRINKIFKIDL